MATNTYTELRTSTVTGSSVASVTLDLTGISGYTDLVLVSSAKSTASDTMLVMQFNADTSNSGTSYSYSRLYGNGSSVATDRASNNPWIPIGRLSISSDTHYGQGIAHIMNYANSTTYKLVLTRGDNASSMTYISLGLWRATPTPITSVTISVANAASNLAVGSTFTVYGIAANSETFAAKATGGTITHAIDGYTYHTFTSTATFTPSVAMSAEVLVIAGGGAGGRFGGGGGGAGGLRNATLSLTQNTSYTATVGGQATNSTFSTITSTGGGGGYDYYQQGGTGYGPYNGGSGGGARYGGGSFGTGNAGGFTPPEGYNGGGSYAGGNANYGCGGGGGAGQVGADGANSSNSGGKGGDGVNTYSTWATVTSTGVNGYYAGGGGGSTYYASPGAGGAGGGGGGSGNGGTGGSGTANTGSGGGGSGSGNYAYGQGGSGIVIVRYLR